MKIDRFGLCFYWWTSCRYDGGRCDYGLLPVSSLPLRPWVVSYLSPCRYGEVMDVNLPRDKATGKQRGFGFLMYEDQRSTVLAVDNLNGAQVLGRTLRVDHVQNYKQPKVKGEDGEFQESAEQSLNAKPLLVRGMSIPPSFSRILALSMRPNKQTMSKNRMMARSHLCRQSTPRIPWLVTFCRSEERKRLSQKPKTRENPGESMTVRTRRLKNDGRGKNVNEPNGRPRRKSGEPIQVLGRLPLESEATTWSAAGIVRMSDAIRRWQGLTKSAVFGIFGGAAKPLATSLGL